MAESATYNVICTGEITDGFDLDQVQNSFAGLFNLSPEKAVAFLSSKRTLKKDLPLNKAQAYKNKLESIGVVTVLEKIELEPASSFAGLSLEPMQEPESQAPQAAAVSTMGGLALEPMDKPPAKQISEGVSGAAPTEKHVAGERLKPAENSDETTIEEEIERLNLAAIGAAAAAAFGGALVWKFIAIVFNYELGIVAWGIGIVVGYAALAMGSRGQLCGIVCGVLALLSILGGKYMVVTGIQEDLSEMFTEGISVEELNYITEEQQELGIYFVENVTDDQSLRVFIVDNDYSEFDEPELVTQDEIDYFNTYARPMYEGMADGEFDMAGWMKQTYEREMENVSNWELFKSSFGAVDIVFLFLGVGTAFKLGSGRTEE